jgi:LacI family gluconate utilization system Gnt-I transcriptional repressor
LTKDKKAARPTMTDVASQAGVSQMTVSRVINNKGYISDDVRRRVETAADEIGYMQNRLAHSLRSKNTRIIAVVLPSLGNTVFTDTLSGITDAVAQQGFRPVFGVTEYSQSRENELVRDLLTWQPYGILLAGLEHSNDTRNAIEASGTRVAEIMDIDGTPISVAFGLSQKKAGEVTAQYMLGKGYRRFAYIGSLGGRDLRATKRFNGFLETLIQAGATCISRDIASLPSSMVEGLRMTAEVMARLEKPDAIYYANDDLAAGGIMYCIANNIKIPEDVALAGFNGLPFLDALPIQLTTVQTPRYEMGRQAGQFLVGSNQQSSTSSESFIDVGFKLIPGETC